MKKIYKYEAFDGKMFDTEIECVQYENSHEEIRKIKEAAKTIANYCATIDCRNCIFTHKDSCIMSDFAPCDWKIK